MTRRSRAPGAPNGPGAPIAPGAMPRDLHLRAWVLLFGACAVATLLHYRFLFAFPGPLGLDGFYYVQRVEGILKGGEAFASSLLFPILALPSLLLSDSVIGIKVGVIVIALLTHLLVFRTVFELTGRAWAATLSVLICSAPVVARWGLSEFLKSTSALLPIAAILYAFTRWGHRPAIYWCILLLALVPNPALGWLRELALIQGGPWAGSDVIRDR